MAVRSGKKKTIAIRPGRVLPRNHTLGPRNKGVLWDLLGSDVTVRPISVLTDTVLQVTGAYSRDVDTGALVSTAFEVTADLRFVITEALLLLADVTARVSVQSGIEYDGMLLVFGAAVHNADTQIAISNARQWLPGLMARISGVVQNELDGCLTVTAAVNRDADILFDITDAGLANADMLLTITKPMGFAVDMEMSVLQRLAPDVETVLVVYGLLIEESHVIQV